MQREKKDQILEAAAECFINFGYDKTSMSDIGKLVGMNKASLYYHFKDKLDIYKAVVMRKRNRLVSQRRHVVEEASPGKDRILAFLCSEIDFAEEMAMDFLAQTGQDHGEGKGADSAFEDIVKEDVDIISSMVDEAQQLGEFKTMDKMELAGIIMKAAKGLLLVHCPLDLPRSQRARGYNQVREDIRSMVGLILNGAM